MMATGEPLVSVVMSLYNYRTFVEESVRSVLNQTHRNLQLIVVDNGSTDGGAKIVRGIDDSRLQLHRLERNQGIAGGLNHGFAHADGEWVVFLPADDRWRRDFLRVMLRSAEESGADLAACWMRVIDRDGQVSEELAARHAPTFNKDAVDLADYTQFRFQNPLAHNLFLWRRDAASRCMPMPLDVIPCDWAMFIRAARQRLRVTVVHEPLFDYRWHGDNLGARMDTAEYMLHYYYVHLHEYRRAAAVLADDVGAELAECRSVMRASVLQYIADDTRAARLLLASDLQDSASDEPPAFKDFRAWLTEDREPTPVEATVGLLLNRSRQFEAALAAETNAANRGASSRTAGRGWRRRLMNLRP